MGKILSTIFLASATFLLTGCNASKEKGNEKDNQKTETSLMTEENQEYTELSKVPLPCSKEDLSAAWKRIGVIETQRRKALDYKQHLPMLFKSTDLDKDDNPEILLRGEPPYAAIFTYANDSLQLITFIDNAEKGFAITQDGVILRNGIGHNHASISEFILLENSQIASSGAICESFDIKDNVLVSGGIRYLLQTDSAMVDVSKEEYQQVAPQQEGTYLEDIDGWEDFRTP